MVRTTFSKSLLEKCSLKTTDRPRIRLKSTFQTRVLLQAIPLLGSLFESLSGWANYKSIKPKDGAT
jgi:hypothetical protein